jgi:putative FmdB family regulatory protein
MPTYEYRCPEGHEFERFQKMTAARARCPVCGRTASRQISGGAGLIFKGSGFYITDYGKDGKGPRQEKDTEAKPEAPVAKSEGTGGQLEQAARPDKSEKSENGEKKPPKKKGSS